MLKSNKQAIMAIAAVLFMYTIVAFDVYVCVEVVQLHETGVPLDPAVHSLSSSHGTLTVAAQVLLHCRGPDGQSDCHCYLHGDADEKSSVPMGLAKTLH